MTVSQSGTSPTIRQATIVDIAQIEWLDSFSASPTRDIHRDMEKYFGSVDPSTHEHTFIFLVEIADRILGKAELMLPPSLPTNNAPIVGYVKRVIVHPDARGQGLARQLFQHIIEFARSEHYADLIDLHVWDGNQSAIRLYESMGFQLQHRELYYRLDLP
jgi:ribosomal protein S18 acetylase RimI-like enzyme